MGSSHASLVEIMSLNFELYLRGTMQFNIF